MTNRERNEVGQFVAADPTKPRKEVEPANFIPASNALLRSLLGINTPGITEPREIGTDISLDDLLRRIVVGPADTSEENK
jgi:hypothetical protein